MKIKTLKSLNAYPRQFWLLFVGILISTAGVSMIWPFLMIYVSDRLGLPMTTTAVLLSVNAIASLIASAVAGPISDRTGRKGIMVIGLVALGLTYLAMIPAKTYLAFFVLMTLRGLVNPLFRIGGDAMIADIIPEEQRADAYALSRLAKNLGIAVGPALGGFVATNSYAITFVAAAAGLIIFSLITLFFLEETLPAEMRAVSASVSTGTSGFKHILQDRAFLTFIGAFLLTQLGSAILWVLLGDYAKDNYQILEKQFGFIPMTNALMVVFFQVFITRYTQQKSPLSMMTWGALIYALGVGSVALGDGFWDFWGSMVLLTTGELILVPTATTYTANLAPPDMRGRYMSVFTLTWGVALGIGPVIGGVLNDWVSPQAIWYGGGIIGIAGAAWFWRQLSKGAPLTQAPL